MTFGAVSFPHPVPVHCACPGQKFNFSQKTHWKIKKSKNKKSQQHIDYIVCAYYIFICLHFYLSALPLLRIWIPLFSSFLLERITLPGTASFLCYLYEILIANAAHAANELSFLLFALCSRLLHN